VLLLAPCKQKNIEAKLLPPPNQIYDFNEANLWNYMTTMIGKRFRSILNHTLLILREIRD
jgi:hypothetical protein